MSFIFDWIYSGFSSVLQFLGNVGPLFSFVIPFNPTYIKVSFMGFPGGAVVENLPANAGDTGSSPGLGGSHMPRSD